MPSEEDDAAEEHFARLLERYDEASALGLPVALPNADELSPERFRELAALARRIDLVNQAARQQVIAASGGTGQAETILPGDPFAGETIGRFRVLRELGRGGYGIVFLAYDPGIGRLVAIKLPRPEVLATANLRARFLREAQAAGRIDHPHVLPVHEAAEDAGMCYLVTPYCRGLSLAEWFAGRGPVPAYDVAQLGSALADALACAHESGVLHRDIKPANILLDLAATDVTADRQLLTERRLATFVPKLTDFGLAKLLQSSEWETRTGTLVGTPTYMAPEQAVGRYADVRTDVYALGLVLYELLTGLLPVDASLAAGLAVTGAEAQIVPPRKLQSSIPRDLEAVVLKCLESSPADRYSSAAALAEDLRRFLHGKSTVARPAGILRKTWRAARRRPGLSLMSLLLLALGVTFIADDRWYAAKLSSTTSALHSSEYARDIRNAAAARRRGKAEQASALLAKYDDGQPGAASRGIEWYWLREALKPRAREINSQHGEAYCVLFSPDGQLLYSGGQDGVIRVWSTADGALLREMRGHGQAIAGGDCCVNQLGLGYDSNTLFSVSCDRTVRKWDARSGRLAGIVCRGETDLTCLAVARLHPWLALSNRGGAIQIWDFAANRILAEFLASEPKSRIDSIQFRPDDRKLVATAGVDMSVVIDTRSWSVEHRQKLGAESLCFVGREGMLALGSSLWVDSLMPWDTNSGTLGSRLGGLSTRIKSLAALDKHGVVFAGGAAGELHAMNLQRNVSRVMLASNSCVQGLATSADERQLASASFDGLLRIWNLQCDRQPLRLGGRHPVVSIALTSAADYAVALNSRAILTAWDITRNQMVGELADRHLAVCSQSGKFAIVKYPSVRKFGLVRLPSLRAVATVPEIDGLMSASISADDIHFATLDARGQVLVFDLRSATPIAEFNLPAQMDPASTQIALTPDATGLAWIRSGLLHHEAWDILQNRPMALPEDLSFLAAAVTYPPVMISPDGTRTLKSPDGSGDHLIVDIRTGADLALLRHPDRYRSDGAWTPDGRRIILPTHAGRHVIINADNGEALCELDTPLEPHFGPVQVSPDGETIQLISWTETPSQFYRTIWRAPRAASTGDRQ